MGRLKQNRHMIITAFPRLPGRLRTLFTAAEGSLRKVIENIPYLRYAGWNLPTEARGEIVRGEFIRVGGPDYRLLDVYRDGTTIFAVRADGDFLAWATPQNEQRINPTALVEVVYNFTNFYEYVLRDFEEKPDYIFIRVDLKNLHLNGIKTYLLPYDSAAWRFGRNRDVHFAPEDSMTKSIRFAADNYTPAVAAFEILREIYLWFGFDEDKIPYTITGDDQRKIDTSQILNLKE